MLNSIRQNVKNVVGWKTKRKILVFNVDDYGNIRIASRQARKNINAAGYKANGWFDELDTLETHDDLEMLYEVLCSVKDKNGHPAVFTPLAVTCNMDYDRMKAENYEAYRYEVLPDTFSKLEAVDPTHYKGTWDLWQEGIRTGIMRPQFHGREHFSVYFLEEKLKQRDKEMLTILENRSYTMLTNPIYKGIGQAAAFGFSNYSENESFKSVIKDGLDIFEDVFGYRSQYFTAPAGCEHHSIYKWLSEGGIKYIDNPMIKKEHQGQGKFKTKFYYTGLKNGQDLTYVVRNVVFEPTEPNGVDHLNVALKQIERAFKWNRPAIVSSHRVNFCGYNSSENRKEGLFLLKQLLKKVVERWPDVEFMSADQLCNLIYDRDEVE